MKKPSVIQVAAGTTLALSMGANAWYGIDEWHRGGPALILAGVWMPVAIVLLERIMHALDLSKGATYGFRLGLFVVAAFCMYYSMSHLAHVATPATPSPKERFDGWIVAISVDVVMVLSGLALMMTKHRTMQPATEFVERIVEKIIEVQVPVEVEKFVYIERPALRVDAEVQETEVETVTETRQVTRTSSRKAAMTVEQHAQILEIIGQRQGEIIEGSLKASEIMAKVGLDGHPNKITRLPEWKAIKG